jgi:hypothetical protein
MLGLGEGAGRSDNPFSDVDGEDEGAGAGGEDISFLASPSGS